MKENNSLDGNQKANDNKRYEISKKSYLDGSSSSGGKPKL